MTSAAVRRDVVIVTCAISAGVHGALVQEHLREGVAPGAGFAVATLLLAVLALALTHDASPLALRATTVVLAGLLLSYGLVVAAGIPLLHPEREAVDGLALFTKAVEAVGLAAASSLVRRPSLIREPSRPVPVALSALVGLFSAVAALAVANGMDMSTARSGAAHPAPPTMTVSGSSLP